MTQLSGDEVLPTLCADKTDWSTYFTVSAAVDLAAIKSYVCATNWTAVYHELITDLDVPYIESQVSTQLELGHNCQITYEEKQAN